MFVTGFFLRFRQPESSWRHGYPFFFLSRQKNIPPTGQHKSETIGEIRRKEDDGIVLLRARCSSVQFPCFEGGTDLAGTHCHGSFLPRVATCIRSDHQTINSRHGEPEPIVVVVPGLPDSGRCEFSPAVVHHPCNAWQELPIAVLKQARSIDTPYGGGSRALHLYATRDLCRDSGDSSCRGAGYRCRGRGTNRLRGGGGTRILKPHLHFETICLG